jgi:hypothetical protein
LLFFSLPAAQLVTLSPHTHLPLLRGSKGDLVFYGQNGYIEKFLEEQQLSGSAASQVLVYMAVAKLGEKPTDGEFMRHLPRQLAGNVPSSMACELKNSGSRGL